MAPWWAPCHRRQNLRTRGKSGARGSELTDEGNGWCWKYDGFGNPRSRTRPTNATVAERDSELWNGDRKREPKTKPASIVIRTGSIFATVVRGFWGIRLDIPGES
ncbi:hypothetical protein BD779DRAFT_1480669 [Infundibulicybe gibba]|nr:hypothetical protein BD779DRAFT_1480669 [Infundibulicybe gibba]